MIICVSTFTDEGKNLANQLKEKLPEITWIYRTKEEALKAWVADCFAKHLPILMIGATGIAVRSIAPFVSDKLQDSPVLVMDEKGQFVIPLLSGHLGGANELAEDISRATGATCVTTTATDVENHFAVDLFAKKNGLRIVNRDGIQKISSKILSGEQIRIWINPKIQLPIDKETGKIDLNLPKELIWINKESFENAGAESQNSEEMIDYQGMSEYADIRITLTELPVDEENPHCLIQLIPKTFCVGLGCKKGKTFEEINNFAQMVLKGVLWKESLLQGMTDQIYAFASIDLKKNEIGLMTFAQYYHLPFYTYTADQLNQVPGSFEESDFVKQTTGVSNVCERAAVYCAGDGAQIAIHKTACDGMTLAVAKRIPSIEVWQ